MHSTKTEMDVTAFLKKPHNRIHFPIREGVRIRRKKEQVERLSSLRFLPSQITNE